MCESQAVKIVGGKEKIVMDNVARLTPKGDSVIMEGLFGDRLEIKGTVEKIDFVGHKIYITEKQSESLEPESP